MPKIKNRKLLRELLLSLALCTYVLNIFSMADMHKTIGSETTEQFNIWDAIAKGENDTVRKAIAQGLEVNVCNSEGWTLLHEAARHGHTEIVVMLIEAGADLNAVNLTEYVHPRIGLRELKQVYQDVFIAIMQSSTEKRAFCVPRLIIAVKPIHRACMGGHIEVTRILINSGAAYDNLQDLPTVEQVLQEQLKEKLG